MHAVIIVRLTREWQDPTVFPGQMYRMTARFYVPYLPDRDRHLVCSNRS